MNVLPNGVEVRRLRELRMWHQEDLAEKSGVPKDLIGAIERGYRTLHGKRDRTRVRPYVIECLAGALKVAPEELVVHEIKSQTTLQTGAPFDALASYLKSTVSAYRASEWTDRAAELHVQCGEEPPLLGSERLMSWVASSHRVCFLVGDFGSGKSYLARRLASELAEAHLAAQTGLPLPLFVELLRARHLIPHTEQEVLSLTSPVAPAHAISLGGIKPLLVILDGLDELLDPSDPSPPPYFEVIAAICRLTGPETRFLVTCREWTFSPISRGLQTAFRRPTDTKADAAINQAMGLQASDALVLQVCDLTPEESDRYLSQTPASTAWVRVRSDSSYRQLAQRPFTLRLLERALPGMGDLTKELDLARLFELATKARFLADFPPGENAEQAVACMMTQLECAVFDELVDPKKETADRHTFIHEGTLSEATVSLFKQKQLVWRQLIQTGLLKQSDDGKLRFLHYSLVEFFVARRLFSEIKDYIATTLTKLNLVDAYNINRLVVPMLRGLYRDSAAPDPQNSTGTEDRAVTQLRLVSRGEYKKFLTATKWRNDLPYGFRPKYTADDGTPYVSEHLVADPTKIEVRKDPTEGPDNEPVTCVSWYDAFQYCRWCGYRLPTGEEFMRSRLTEGAGVDYVWTGDWHHEPHAQMAVVTLRQGSSRVAGVNPDLRNDHLGICVAT